MSFFVPKINITHELFLSENRRLSFTHNSALSKDDFFVKSYITIPPCDGSAPNGRKGYAIWGPSGIISNYINPSESITQEWEMADDLGDSHLASLQQGGKLPTNSTECRIVGKIHASSQENISVELYPLFNNLSIDILLLDNNCSIIDSVSGTGTIIHDFIISGEDIKDLAIATLCCSPPDSWWG